MIPRMISLVPAATVSAEAASTTDARHLEVARGEPMLVERRVIVDLTGRPVEATESRYVGARYAIEVRFDVQDANAEVRHPLGRAEAR